VKQFLKSVNIRRSYRQEVTNRPIIICKSILLQYLFFCVAADAYSDSVGILVSPLCISFSQWTEQCKNYCKDKEFLTTVLSGWVLHDSLLDALRSWALHFLKTDISQSSVETQLRCGGIVNDNFVANLLVNLLVKEFRKSVNTWRSYGQDYGGLFFIDSQCSRPIGVLNNNPLHLPVIHDNR